MQRNLLQTYLSRYASGDLKIEGPLIKRLGNRLLHLPVQKGSSPLSFKAMTFVFNNNVTVPVFTTPLVYKEWKKINNIECDSLPLTGGDICAVLPSDWWIVIDPVTDYAAYFSPDCIQRIASTEVEEDLFASEPQNEEKTRTTVIIERPEENISKPIPQEIAESVPRVTQSQPVVVQQTEEQKANLGEFAKREEFIGKPISVPSPKGSPTVYVAGHSRSSEFSSKSIILDEEETEKKKSFLGFLRK